MRVHKPNHIPASQRVFNVLLSVLLFSYGTYSVWVDDMLLPRKHRPGGVHLHGEPAWIMYMAILCAVLNMVSVVIDHYDTRDNEKQYRRFQKMTQWIGWLLAILAISVEFFALKKATRS